MVSVMSTSNTDGSQFDNGQSSQVTVYAATVWSCDGVRSDSVTVYAVTVWQCDCVRSDSVTASVYTAAE